MNNPEALSLRRRGAHAGGAGGGSVASSGDIGSAADLEDEAGTGGNGSDSAAGGAGDEGHYVADARRAKRLRQLARCECPSTWASLLHCKFPDNMQRSCDTVPFNCPNCNHPCVGLMPCRMFTGAQLQRAAQAFKQRSVWMCAFLLVLHVVFYAAIISAITTGQACVACPPLPP